MWGYFGWGGLGVWDFWGGPVPPTPPITLSNLTYPQIQGHRVRPPRSCLGVQWVVCGQVFLGEAVAARGPTWGEGVGSGLCRSQSRGVRVGGSLNPGAIFRHVFRWASLFMSLLTLRSKIRL